MMVESLVMKKVHGIIHCGSDVEGRGNNVVGVRFKGVTVVEDPTSFSPFPSTDCMLYSHFSFEDFVMIAFPDLTRDLNDQI